MYDKRSTWNPTNCECGCDKSSDVADYLDYEHCKCRKRLVDELNEKCTKTGEEAKIPEIYFLGLSSIEHENKCKSLCAIYVVLIVMVFYNLHWNWCLFCLLQIHESLVLKKNTF